MASSPRFRTTNPSSFSTLRISHTSAAQALRAILLTAKHLGRRNAKFRISSVSPSVSEIFTVSGFDRIIPIFKTQDAAVEAKD